MWATVRYLRKMIQTPTASPCSSLPWETGRLGRPGGRALPGSVPRAWQQGDTLPTWDQSSVFPAWVFLFRCQSLSLALCLEVYKKYQGYQARRLTYQTTTLQARGICLKNSSHVILKLVFAAAELYPHPLQSHISKVLSVHSFLPEGRGAQLFVWYCTVMLISAIKVVAKLTWNVL